MINGELNHYGEIGKIIGKDNLFFLDELHPIYIGEGKSLYGNHKKNIKLVESYPSNFGFDKPNYIQLKEVLKNKVKFDFAIFSYKSYEENYKLIPFLKSQKTKVVMFDKNDDQAIFFDKEKLQIRKKYKLDFDIILKQDIPLENKEINVYPIAPIPCVIDENKINLKKSYYDSSEITFFFSGDYRKNQTRKDRLDLVNYINNNFSNHILNLTTRRSKFFSKNEQDRYLYTSKVNISASGKVWDSYRHCELVNYGAPILIPKPDVKTATGEFIDMKNCIIYDTDKTENDYILKNAKELKLKLNEVINNKKIRSEIYENYYSLIKNYHSRIKRSEYIVNIFKSHLK